MSLGPTHSAFIIEGGKIITTGSNYDAQLGLGHARPSYRPGLVLQLAELSIIVSKSDQRIVYSTNDQNYIQQRVQSGSSFTLASNSENVIYFWGARHLNPITSIGVPKY